MDRREADITQLEKEIEEKKAGLAKLLKDKENFE